MITTVYTDGTYSTTVKIKCGSLYFNNWYPDMSTSFYGNSIYGWSINGTVSTYNMTQVHSVTSNSVPVNAIYVDGNIFTDDKEARRWLSIFRMREGWQLPTTISLNPKSIIRNNRYFKINNALSSKQKYNNKRRNCA